MLYWGIDIAKEMLALVARDESGEVVRVEIVRTADEAVGMIAPTDAVVIEWTGGKARPLLEALAHKGVAQLYLYKGSLRVDRLHLGLPRKGDAQDAMTLSYALWASLTRKVPFRPNGLVNYLQMRSVYELRSLWAQAESLTKEAVRLNNRLQAYMAAGINEGTIGELIAHLRVQADLKYQELRLRCYEHPQVRQVLRVLQQLFPHSERAIYGLAVQLAPLERFSSVSALKRYCEVLPTRGESGGKVVERKRWRGGNRSARVLMYRLLIYQLRIGNGEGQYRGKWRDYYDRLRRRLTHGQAMVRLMNRLLELIWRAYHREPMESVSPASARGRQRGWVQEQFLRLIAQGLSDAQAAKALGLHYSTPSQWKRRDEQFLERYVRARAAALQGGERDGERASDTGAAGVGE